MRSADLGPVHVRWLGGALLLDHAHGCVLVEAPPGVDTALTHTRALGRLRTVVVASDRMRSLGGLLGLCDAVTTARGTRPALHVLHPLEVERVATVADAWVRGWPEGVRLELDAAGPGVPVDATGGVEITFLPLTLGEPAGDVVRPVAGSAVRVALGGVEVAWVPATRSQAAARRACHGADLAVVEAGRRPWPASGHGWRPDPALAAELGCEAATCWVVGDDGVWLDPADLLSH